MSNNPSVFHRGWWIVANVVHCFSRASFATSSTMRWAVAESKPVVGSSSIKTRGWATTSMPMDTRFRCPPERPSLTMRSLVAAKPRPSTTASTRLETRSLSLCRVVVAMSTPCSDLLANRSRAWNRMFSETVRDVCITSSCGTYPHNGRNVAICHGIFGMPFSRRLPDNRPSPHRPDRTDSNVVLPLPEAPITATIAPAGMSSVNSFSNFRSGPTW
mmetsp:Transcript_14844/g.42781  ORF Transcript_14844/g.42781 Transcript_14844/m.42781 type:complete len:216 (+) Transcript_14844:969-1616(+)